MRLLGSLCDRDDITNAYGVSLLPPACTADAPQHQVRSQGPPTSFLCLTHGLAKFSRPACHSILPGYLPFSALWPFYCSRRFTVHTSTSHSNKLKDKPINVTTCVKSYVQLLSWTQVIYFPVWTAVIMVGAVLQFSWIPEWILGLLKQRWPQWLDFFTFK